VVLAGCLFGGLAMAATLSLSSGVAHEAAIRSERGRRVAVEAVVSGLLVAVGVALWFLVLDLLQGRPFFTPADIGSALLHGARGVESVVVYPIPCSSTRSSTSQRSASWASPPRPS
jgi:hypothetical protein